MKRISFVIVNSVGLFTIMFSLYITAIMLFTGK